MTVSEKEARVLEDFAVYDDWMDKYEYIIGLGKGLGEYPESLRSEDRLIKGCQSRVWLNAEVRDGRIFFSADSDAIITKGIIALLIDLYSGATPEEILASDFSVIQKLGLRENLSPTRANGLVSMLETIRRTATEAFSGTAAGNSPLK